MRSLLHKMGANLSIQQREHLQRWIDFSRALYIVVSLSIVLASLFL